MQTSPSPLWLTFDQLALLGVQEQYIRVALKRNRDGASSWNHKKDPNDKRKVLIDYDSIPDSTITKYSIPSKAVLRARIEQDQMDAMKAAAIPTLRRLHNDLRTPADFTYYTLTLGLNKEKAIGLSISAAWLTLLSHYKSKTSIRKLEISHLETKGQLVELVLGILKEDQPEGLKVSNKRVLMRRESAFKSALNTSRNAALDTLVHGLCGNHNAQKLTPEGEALLLSLYINANEDVKYLPGQIHMKYQMAANGDCMQVDSETGEILGKVQPISLSTVKAFLNTAKVKVISAKYRHGNKYYKDTFRPYVKGVKPRYALSMTSSDGEHVPFRLIKGGKATYKRAVCYFIFDVHSGAVAGYAIAEKETKELLKDAFRNMLVWTEGIIPIENQLDNFGKSSTKMLKEIYPITSFCQPYNAQAKFAERLILDFEQQHLRIQPGWCGANIQSKKQDNKQNPDLPQVAYTLDEIRRMYAKEIRAWNNKVLPTGLTRAGTLKQNINPDCKTIQDRTMADLVGYAKVETIRRSFIKMRVSGQEYVFRVPNYNQIIPELKNGMQVRVRFLPHLLNEKVWIYNYTRTDAPDEDTFLCECPYAESTQRSRAEQTKEDGRVLGTYLKSGEDFDNWVEEEVENVPQITLVPKEGSLEPEEAELVLAAGYTDKDLMQEAEEVLSTRPEIELNEEPREVDPRWALGLNNNTQ